MGEYSWMEKGKAYNGKKPCWKEGWHTYYSSSYMQHKGSDSRPLSPKFLCL